MLELISRFTRAQKGVAAIEFALLLPLLVFLMLGSVDLLRFLRIERQLTLAASSIANMLSQRQVGDTTILNFDFDALQLHFPLSVSQTGQYYDKIGHQATSAVFTPSVTGCVQNCQYRADVAWVWPVYNTGLEHMKRKCGTLAPKPQGASEAGATIPAAMFGPGSVVIVDLSYTFEPLFGSSVVPAIKIFRQGYANARFATPYLVIPATDWAGNNVRCPGFG